MPSRYRKESVGTQLTSVGALATFQFLSNLAFGIVSARALGPSSLAPFALASIIVRFPIVMIKWAGPTQVVIAQQDLGAAWVQAETRRLSTITIGLAGSLLLTALWIESIVLAFCALLGTLSSLHSLGQIRIQRARRLPEAGLRLEAMLTSFIFVVNAVLTWFMWSNGSIAILFMNQFLVAMSGWVVALRFERLASENENDVSGGKPPSAMFEGRSMKRFRTETTLSQLLDAGRLNAIQLGVAVALPSQDVAGFWKVSGVISGPLEAVANRQIQFLRGRSKPSPSIREPSPRIRGRRVVWLGLLPATATLFLAWLISDDLISLLLGAAWQSYSRLAFPFLLSTLGAVACWWTGLVVVQLGHPVRRLILQILSIILCLCGAAMSRAIEADVSLYAWILLAVILFELSLLYLTARRYGSWLQLIVPTG